MLKSTCLKDNLHFKCNRENSCFESIQASLLLGNDLFPWAKEKYTYFKLNDKFKPFNPMTNFHFSFFCHFVFKYR